MSWDIQEFTIEKKNDWKNNTEYYESSIKLSNDKYERVQVNLSRETTNEVLKVIYPDLTFAFQEAVDTIREKMIDQLKTKPPS